MPTEFKRIEVDSYNTWEGKKRVTFSVGGKNVNLNRDEARALRDDLTRELEEITQDEEREP